MGSVTVLAAELRLAARHGDRLDHRERAAQREPARPRDLAEHEDARAVDLADEHRHRGVVDVRRERLRETRLELRRRLARGLDLARERERDAAVGPHRDDARQLRLVPHHDLQHVLAADPVLARIGALAGPLGDALRRRARREEPDHRQPEVPTHCSKPPRAARPSVLDAEPFSTPRASARHAAAPHHGTARTTLPARDGRRSAACRTAWRQAGR
jgi:hypothetical protein